MPSPAVAGPRRRPTVQLRRPDRAGLWSDSTDRLSLDAQLLLLLAVTMVATVAPAAKLKASVLLRSPGVAPALLTSLALLAAVDILTAYLPLVALERQFSATVVGVLLALRAATSLASRIGLGWISARWGHDLLIRVSTLGSGLALAVIALPVDSLPVLALAAAGGGLLLGIGQPLTMTMVVRAVPAGARGAALALRLVSNRVGQVMLPAVAAVGAGRLGASGALWCATATLLASAGVARVDARRLSRRTSSPAAADSEDPSGQVRAP